MAKSNTKLSYDREEDILNLSRGISSQASIEVGDFIIDIDSNGFVSALEILNASENLNFNPELLNNFEKANMSVLYKPDYIQIILTFYFQGKEKEVVIPLTVDLGHKHSHKEEIIFA